MSETLDEFYIWGPFESRVRFDERLWKNFHVATKFGRYRFMKRAKCLHCKKEVGWCGFNINLKNHMARHHREIWSEKRRCETMESLLRDYGGRERREGGDRWVPANTIKRLGGKHDIWKLFSINPGYPRYVKCEICEREVYWNRRGMGKLKTHIEKHHLNKGG
jgi:hypothetical protein